MSHFTDALIDDIIKREGSFVNHPADKGGPTKFGITQATLANWLGRTASTDDVKNLTQEEAKRIYQARYVAPFMQLVYPPLIEQCVDAGVNHGVGQAIKLLQRALGKPIVADGIIGPQTLAAVEKADGNALTALYIAVRLELYATILQRDSSQLAFAAGWMNRMAGMTRAYSKSLPAPASPAPMPDAQPLAP